MWQAEQQSALELAHLQHQEQEREVRNVLRIRNESDI